MSLIATYTRTREIHTHDLCVGIPRNFSLSAIEPVNAVYSDAKNSGKRAFYTGIEAFTISQPCPTKLTHTVDDSRTWLHDLLEVLGR